MKNQTAENQVTSRITSCTGRTYRL